MSQASNDILAKIPDNFDMEFAQIKYPVLWENSMNTVLCQELIRFNNLLTLLRQSLDNILKAVKGLVVMSSELEVLSTALFFNRIPALWKARSYPSLKPLASYVNDLLVRLDFFNSWLQKLPPAVFWISGFFFTQVQYLILTAKIKLVIVSFIIFLGIFDWSRAKFRPKIHHSYRRRRVRFRNEGRGRVRLWSRERSLHEGFVLRRSPMGQTDAGARGVAAEDIVLARTRNALDAVPQGRRPAVSPL